MSNRTVLAVVALLATSSARAADPPAPAAQPSCKVADLSWMAGSWAMDKGRAHIEEHWMCPTQDSLVGMGRTTVKGKTAFFEFLRIEERPDGVFYVAQPKGGPPTPFKLVRCEKGSAVFENLEHDFPKRVLYRRAEDGSLVARVEGDASSKEKAEDFPYKRQAPACP